MGLSDQSTPLMSGMASPQNFNGVPNTQAPTTQLTMANGMPLGQYGANLSYSTPTNPNQSLSMGVGNLLSATNLQAQPNTQQLTMANGMPLGQYGANLSYSTPTTSQMNNTGIDLTDPNSINTSAYQSALASKIAAQGTKNYAQDDGKVVKPMDSNFNSSTTSQMNNTPLSGVPNTPSSTTGQTSPSSNPYGSNPFVNSTNPYIQAAQASASGNINAANAATAANRVNQNTPYGSLQYSQTGTDANGNPIWSANQTLSQPLENLTNTSLSNLNASLNNPAYGINPGQTYSDAIMSRLQPQIAHQNEMSDQALANQGIMPGSQAYENAKRVLGQQQNDLQTSAIINGMNTGLQAQQLQNTTAANVKALGTPSYVNPYNQAAVAAPDYLGAYSTANAADIAKANAQMAQQTAQMNGLLGLGSSALLGGTGQGSVLNTIGNGAGAIGSGLSSLWNQIYNPTSNPIIADTGQAAQTAQDFYGTAYDPSAGWSM